MRPTSVDSCGDASASIRQTIHPTRQVDRSPRGMDVKVPALVDHCEHSARHLHAVQHLHIPRTHIHRTGTRTSVGAHRSTEPIRSVEPERCRSGDAHPMAMPIWAYDVYSHIKANYFGNKILRMAGIVQMLHAIKPPYDKYPYAHRERTFKA